MNQNGAITGDTTFALHGNLKLYGQVDMSIFAIGDGDSTQVYGTVMGRKYIPGNPNNFNYTSSILSDSLILGDLFENFGLIDVKTLIVGGQQMVNRSGGQIRTSVMAVFGGLATNESGAIMEHFNLQTTENILNNGDISCTDWTHSQGIASGTTGKYCISNCFMNLSTIQGTLDVCDNSPGGFCDVNMGTIAASVTTCVQPACATMGIMDDQTSQFVAYPNPVYGNLLVKADPNERLVIYSLNGSILFEMIGNPTYTIDLSGLANGIYILKQGEQTFRIVKD